MSSSDRRVSVRLPAADVLRLKRLEQGLDRNTSAVLRLGLAHLDDAAPDRWDVPPELRQRLDTLSHAVDRVGVNINQMVHLAHLKGLDTACLDTMREELTGLIADLRQGVLCPCQS